VQLVELQDAWPALEARGVALFGLSYDAVPTLAGFAEKRGITFPLLSDEGSHTVRALGLLNQHVAEQHAFYGIAMQDQHEGIPYPGTFVLDEGGIITEKRFEQSYRVRPTAAMFQEFALGPSSAVPSGAARAEGRGLQVEAWTDGDTYRPYQQVRLHVQIALAPGLHVYVPPVPEGYVQLQLEVDPLEGLTVGEPDLPAGRPFRVEGLDEQFAVLEGTVPAIVPLSFTQNLGQTTVRLTVRYQTCSETDCFPPAAISAEVGLTGLDVIRD
jgi:peroxiredoxin